MNTLQSDNLNESRTPDLSQEDITLPQHNDIEDPQEDIEPTQEVSSASEPFQVVVEAVEHPQATDDIEESIQDVSSATEPQVIDDIEDSIKEVVEPSQATDDIEDSIQDASSVAEPLQATDDIEDSIQDASSVAEPLQATDDIEDSIKEVIEPPQATDSIQEATDDIEEVIEPPQTTDALQLTPEVTRVTECPPAPQRPAPITFVAARRILFDRLRSSINDLEVNIQLNDIRRSRSDGDLPLEKDLLADDNDKIDVFDENFQSLKATVSELESLPPSSHKWKANRLVPRIRNPQRSLNRSAVPPREVARLEVEARIFRNYKK